MEKIWGSDCKGADFHEKPVPLSFQTQFYDEGQARKKTQSRGHLNKDYE
jgi:hypothetical protein